jgi:hypothetical protein
VIADNNEHLIKQRFPRDLIDLETIKTFNDQQFSEHLSGKQAKSFVNLKVSMF